MQFTKANLRLVEEAIGLAIAELNNQIGLCPDVFAYTDELGELAAKQEQLVGLQARIFKALEREEGVGLQTREKGDKE